jgi:hypothetical protein
MVQHMQINPCHDTHYTSRILVWPVFDNLLLNILQEMVEGNAGILFAGNKIRHSLLPLKS